MSFFITGGTNVMVGQMSYVIIGGTNVGVGQMSGGTNVGRTNVGGTCVSGTKVAPPQKGTRWKQERREKKFQFKP